MKRTLLIVLFSFSVGSFAQEAGFQPIFNGRNFEGWLGDRQYWRVEDGSIVGEVPEGERLEKNHWIIWEEGVLENFELRLQFQISGNPRANSGIQFRAQAKGINSVSGYQADLDRGATWLGRIYDEHGRKLLVERGARVQINADGSREVQTFAKKEPYGVLFREDEWNDYRIVACDEFISIYINGTLFSQLIDREAGERDLSGQLALQLHSGGPMVVKFRDIQLRELESGTHNFEVVSLANSRAPTLGIVPKGSEGRGLNLGFEDGSLTGWTLEGTAFEDQPKTGDDIPNRWPEQVSGKDGQYMLAGFGDGRGRTGRMSSTPFKVAHPWGSFLVGGGQSLGCRVEVVLNDGSDKVVESFRGHNREQMERVFFDLGDYLGQEIFIRIMDESTRPGAFVNYDDFRFHEERPHEFDAANVARVRENPILAHLVPNPHSPAGNGSETVGTMSVQEGFEVDIIAAEPDLHQPIAFTFDDRGRIWVIEAHSYPTKRQAGEGLDKIIIFEDADADGSFETRTVFMDGLNLASGIELGFGGVWVGAAPELLFIPDADGDDVPDGEPVVMLDGFGFQDTHETLNSFIWGPDGWLYGIQGIFNSALIGEPGVAEEDRELLTAGVWRFHPTRHDFEIFMHGGSNPWGMDFNTMGQIFMTHCRSRWGQGATTQVIQNGHFWKQSNRGYADFVSGEAPQDYPVYRNFMLASSRYGWGEGGAGKRGSREVYGGHSPVGAMVYLGDNWPDQYRDHLFSHNLHGHQMNHQINLPEGSGYNTIHAGYDVLYAPEPTYVGVELKYGPDGSVYFCDWVDLQHCHNPKSEQWDRGNGRIYRMAWTDTFKPVKIDLGSQSDSELLALLHHKNDWYARTARRLLQERAVSGSLDASVIPHLIELATEHVDVARRLHGLWTLFAVGGFDEEIAEKLLKDESEYVRAWTIQLLTDEKRVSRSMEREFLKLARSDPSAVVRLYLSSAIPRLSESTAWKLTEYLSKRTEDRDDRYLPKMVWYGLGGLMDRDPTRAFKVADRSAFPELKEYANWYGAKLQGEALDRVLRRLDSAHNQEPMMEAIALAMEGQRGLDMPRRWKSVSSKLYQHENERIAELSREVGAIFGDAAIFPLMRELLADEDAPVEERKEAFQILSDAGDEASIELMVSLLDDEAFTLDVIELTPMLQGDEMAKTLIAQFGKLSTDEQTAVVNAMTTREDLGVTLLDAIEAKEIDSTQLTAYHARELSLLNSDAVNARLERVWGQVKSTPAEMQAKIDKLETFYTEAPLWAFRVTNGSSHYKNLCASCHQPNDAGYGLGPNLEGAGGNGVRYWLENIIDPHAVVGADYELTIVEMNSGQVVSGMVANDTESALTLRTIVDEVTVARSDIKSVNRISQSLMPAGLLETLNETEQVELLKYLSTL